MEGAKIVNKIIIEDKPTEILDLKCRKGYFSILAASYGAHVDVLDDIDHPEFPDYLKMHPNISYHNSTLEDFTITKTYDFIILKHVVIKHEKNFIIQQYIPTLFQHLTKGGKLFITYHFPDSYVMETHPEYYTYSINDFKAMKLNFIIKDFGEYYIEIPTVKMKQEHVGYLILQKG